MNRTHASTRTTQTSADLLGMLLRLDAAPGYHAGHLPAPGTAAAAAPLRIDGRDYVVSLEPAAGRERRRWSVEVLDLGALVTHLASARHRAGGCSPGCVGRRLLGRRASRLTR